MATIPLEFVLTVKKNANDENQPILRRLQNIHLYNNIIEFDRWMKDYNATRVLNISPPSPPKILCRSKKSTTLNKL